MTINLNDAIQLHLKGLLNEAEQAYRQILIRQPNNPDALHLLGVVAYQRKQYSEAVELISNAIALGSRAPEYRNNLGNVYFAQGRIEEAEACYRKALKLNPKYGDAHNNLGNTLKDQGQLQEAANSYAKALKFDPEKPEIHNNLGLVLEGLGQTERAIEQYTEAIRLNPRFFDAYANLGGALKTLGQINEAIDSCEKALAIKPSFARALLNLGNIYSEMNQMEKGAAYFRQALEADPNMCEAHLNLGHALREHGGKEEALLHFETAILLKPKLLAARFGKCIGQIPLLQDSVEEIEQTREKYRKELASLLEELDLSDPQALSQAMRLVGNCQPFFLAYQGENDRDLQDIYGKLIIRIQSACYPAWSKKRPMPATKPGEPLRIGFVSGFYFLHSNWKIPIKGWVENLNRNDFQLFGYYTGRTQDQQTEVARNSFHSFVEGLSSVEQWCDRIARDRLHVLIYPEIGMDPMTVRLASLRLAPIQCTSWGHPNTSGLPTLDYYLSSDLMEPPDGGEHYTEKLVRLPNLSIYYEPPSIASARATRADLGLDDNKTVFLCSQSLFKYLPQFDDVFPRIALEVGDCQFAFLSYIKSPRLGERFTQRLEAAFKRFGLLCADYVKFLPHLDPPRYKSLNEVADVFLDSIGWSGCNSSLEALSCNLPIVTMAGKLMRGRHTHAILSMMGLDGVEANNVEEYIALAARLGRDPALRKDISEKIFMLKEKAYRDIECVRGLELFLKEVVGNYFTTETQRHREKNI
jgi:predicted O-linked N-acetylglucosamine transferase (SPINDLY family)